MYSAHWDHEHCIFPLNRRFRATLSRPTGESFVTTSVKRVSEDELTAELLHAVQNSFHLKPVLDRLSQVVELVGGKSAGDSLGARTLWVH